MMSGICIPFVPCGISSLGGGLVRDAAGAVIGAFVSALTSSAAWMVGHVAGLIIRSTGAVESAGHIQVRQGWFYDRYGVMLQLLALVVVPLLLVATIGPVLRQDLRRLARVWGVGLPVALLAGFLGIQATQMALSATDALCTAVLETSHVKVSGTLGLLATGLFTPGAPQLVVGFIAFLLIAGAVLLWLELVLRTAAIYIATFFMPLALACYVWPATTAITKRTVELLAALIVSKFVIVATLTLGLAAVGSLPPPDNAVVGGAILLLASFAPFTLLRLAPVIETAAIAHLEGMSRRPGRAVGRAGQKAAAAPGSPVVMRLLALGSQRRAESRPLDLAAVVAQRIPERPTDYPTGSTAAQPDRRMGGARRGHG